jgi:histidinol dehydrogenase
MNKIYNPKPETWFSILERPTKTVDDSYCKEISRKFKKRG